MPGTPTRGRCHTEGGVASHWTRPQSSQVRDGGGGARLPIRQPPKGAGLHGARGRGSALDTPTRTPKWAGLKALTRGRGFTVNTCQRGGATERKGAWLRLLVPTKGRGYVAQGAWLHFGHTHKGIALCKNMGAWLCIQKPAKGRGFAPFWPRPPCWGSAPPCPPPWAGRSAIGCGASRGGGAAAARGARWTKTYVGGGGEQP